MDQLYDLFAQAPVLGSLIDPKKFPRGLFVSEFHAFNHSCRRHSPANKRMTVRTN